MFGKSSKVSCFRVLIPYIQQPQATPTPKKEEPNKEPKDEKETKEASKEPKETTKKEAPPDTHT